MCIGVHSPKFTAERSTENLELAVRRMGIAHTVVNDAEREVWGAYAVRAWPTLCLIDPEGYVVGMHAGEFDADALVELIAGLRPEYEQRGTLRPVTETPSELPAEPAAARSAGLSFPAGVAARGDRLWISDTGNHRVLELELEDAEHATLARVLGSGEERLEDGAPTQASFAHPRGLAVHEDTLFVADSGNHAVRAVDLRSGHVRTLAGDGRLGGASTGSPEPWRASLRSPFDVALDRDGRLFVAMAGEHRIWSGEPERLVPYAGNGREALVDGEAREASFNQPSGLAIGGGHLFVADSEASAIRAIELGTGTVRTLVGRGLFEFGDRDGVGRDALLQHPAAVAVGEATVWIADTFNDRIKALSTANGEVRARFGGQQAGERDGKGTRARFRGPEGLALDGRILWVADTNNHRIRRLSLDTERVASLTVAEGR